MADENPLTGSEQPDTPTTDKATAEVKETEAKSDAEPKGSDDGKSEADKSDTGDKAKDSNRSRIAERFRELKTRDRNKTREIARLNREIGKLRAERLPTEQEVPDPAQRNAAAFKRAAREAALESQLEAAQGETESLRAEEVTVWNEAVAEARARFPDFDAKVYAQDNPVSPVMARYFRAKADDGPALAYYLASHRDEALRINGMDAEDAQIALARIEARLSPPKVKQVSSAPKPVTTVSGQGHAPTQKPPTELAGDMKEYARWWKEREGVRR